MLSAWRSSNRRCGTSRRSPTAIGPMSPAVSHWSPTWRLASGLGLADSTTVNLTESHSSGPGFVNQTPSQESPWPLPHGECVLARRRGVRCFRMRTASREEISSSLAHLFLASCRAVARRLQDAGLPCTMEVEHTIVERQDPGGWCTAGRAETRNVLTDWTLVLREAPWLTRDEVAAADRCSEMIARTARKRCRSSRRSAAENGR